MTDETLNALLREHKDDYLRECGDGGGSADGFLEFAAARAKQNPRPFLAALAVDVWNEAPLPNRWQALVESADQLDGDPQGEVQALQRALSRFPQPQFPVIEDYEGYAVHELLCCLLRNRRGGIVGVSREALSQVLYVFKAAVSRDKQKENGVSGAMAELDHVMRQSRPQLPRDRLVNIRVIGRAEEFADDVVPAYGEISAGCGPNVGEDYAVGCMWPVVVKSKLDVTDADLVQHLRDLADLIESRKDDRPAVADLLNEIPA